MAKKQHTLSMSEFRRLIRETAQEMLAEQEGNPFAAEETEDFGGGDEFVAGEEMVVEPAGDEEVGAEEFEVEDLGEEELELPDMESPEEVKAVLDDISTVVQAAADALGAGDEYGEAAEEMAEALKRVENARALLENKKAKESSLRTLAALRKLTR